MNPSPRVQNDERGQGAGVRISGVHRTEGLIDTFDWQSVSYDFAVPSTEQDPNNSEEFSTVELVSELRATSGWSEMRSQH